MQPSPYYAPPQPPPPGNDPYYRQNVFVPPGASSSPLPSPGLKKAKLAAGIVQLVTMLGGLGLIVLGAIMAGNHDESGNTIAGIGMGLFGLWYLVIIAYSILNLVWIYKMWSWVPPEQRHTKMWKKYISPGSAIGFMFIPYFNIYWMFVMYLGMADVFERMNVQYPTTHPSPRNMALIALIVPFVFFPAAPFLQYMFAKQVETIATEMQSKMGRPLAA